MSKVIGWLFLFLMFVAFAVKYQTGISLAVWIERIIMGV
jgi:hypothetical protein